MTFNILTAGSRAQASKVMENFRHCNFGANLLPVNSTGSPVNNTLDIGSSSYSWANIYAQNFYISGVYNVANQPVFNGYAGNMNFNQANAHCLNMSVGKNVGFTYSNSTGAITPPSAGIYRVNAGMLRNDNDPRINVYFIHVFNSSGTLISFVDFARLDAGVYYPNPTISLDLRIDSGDFFKIGARQETSGGTGNSAGVWLTAVKIF